MGANDSPNPLSQGVASGAPAKRRKRVPYHKDFYLGLLIFVVMAGLPLVGLPRVRAQLESRVAILRAAAMGRPAPQAPVRLSVGENPAPFPQEYEHTQKQERPAYLPKIAPQMRAPYRIIIGGDENAASPRETTMPAQKGRLAIPPVSVASGGGINTGEAPASSGGSDAKYKKGKSEQEAYDLLLSANANLAGMVHGSDPTLRFQDWAAAEMGQSSYYVMVTFIQTPDGVARKYIWNVKVATKEIVPLSAYAREISK